jgi:methanethiol S-methyltransferase
MITVILIMGVFAILHSWLAGKTIKNAIRQRVGERAYHGFYRLAYNVFAVITFAPAFLIAILDGGQIIWQVEGLAAVCFIAVQVIGVIGVLVSLAQIDSWRFAGLRQVMAYLQGDPLPLPEEPLQLSGMYAFVRHPLYLFSLMVIWPMVTMSEGLLAFTIGTTLYFILGSLLEERRLRAAYGDRYRDYQQNVPWLIPIPRIRR